MTKFVKSIEPKIILVGMFVMVLLAACNNFKTTTDADGSKYQIHTSKDSKKFPKTGDILSFDLLIKAPNDTTFKNTYKEGTPIMMPFQKGNFKGSFETALSHIAEGDSATIFVSADSLFSRIQQPLPKGVKTGSDLKFIVKMRKVETQQEYTKAQEQKSAGEAKAIEEYVAKNLPNAQKTAGGLYYLTQKAGTGVMPMKGDTVVVNYTGKLINGKVFDSSVGKKPIEFPVGLGYVIPGWEQALSQMKVGEKSTFCIPSALGYGAQGAPGAIPPYSTLVFEIELVNVKQARR